MIIKNRQNPLITCRDVPPSREDFEVVGVFNPGVAFYQGQVHLLLRVAERPIQNKQNRYLCPLFSPESRQIYIQEIPWDAPGFDASDSRVVRTAAQNYLTSISHLRLATSKDGVHFTIDAKPALQPYDEYEAFGVEDARITALENRFYISYSAASSLGIVENLAVTEDFRSYEKLAVIFPPDNKDVVIFPQKIDDYYHCLHRPSTSEYGKPEIWLAQSPDLIHWGRHRRIMGLREGRWDSGRIGASAVPFLTPKGWIEIFHGADQKNWYCLGVALLDRDDPSQILARSHDPLVVPDQPYEQEGFFGNVVFSCGAISRGTSPGDEVTIYYGAADTSIASLTMTLQDIYTHLGI